MVGKGALLVILGFSLIFGIAGRYWNRVSNSAIDNFVSYYDQTTAHNIAASAANIAADSVFTNQANIGISRSNIAFLGGSISFSTQWTVLNGDSDILITARGNYTGSSGSIVDTVKVLMAPTRFTQFAWFTNNENGVWWITGDSLTGPFHTNGKMYINGKPVFVGAVSTGAGLATPYKDPVSISSLPDSHGDKLICTSYTPSVTIPMPSSLGNYDAKATKMFNNTDASSNSTYDVFMTFNSTGAQVSFHTVLVNGSGTTIRVPASGDSTVAVSSLGPVVVVKNGDVHVSGTLDGAVTIVAEQGTGKSANASSSSSSSNYNLYVANGNSTHNGNVIIGGNMTYADNPATNPNSNDKLGIVADNSVMLAAQTSSVTVQAGIFARSGKFFYQEYNKNSPRGTLNLYGSVAQYTRGAVGTVSGSTLTNGYYKNYKFDQRFANSNSAPPSYPSTGTFNILAWRE